MLLLTLRRAAKMYLLIRYPVGIIVEGVILAKGRNRMRVAAAGFPDAIELRRTGSQWFAETSQPVEFDFCMSNAPRGEKVSVIRPTSVAWAARAAATQQ
jgi:hypothetical protein